MAVSMFPNQARRHVLLNHTATLPPRNQSAPEHSCKGITPAPEADQDRMLQNPIASNPRVRLYSLGPTHQIRCRQARVHPVGMLHGNRVCQTSPNFTKQKCQKWPARWTYFLSQGF